MNIRALSDKSAFVLAAALVLAGTTAFAAPKRLATAKPDNCVACHGKEQVLPAGHPKTAKMTFANCQECHPKDGPASLSGKLPLSHKHHLSGANCVQCHGKSKKKEPVAAEVCHTCHEPEQLARKTSGIKPQNPHTSKHYGTSLDCNNCHHQHEKSEDFCIQCHSFNFKLP